MVSGKLSDPSSPESTNIHFETFLIFFEAGDGPYDFRILDHGGVIVAAPYGSPTSSIMCVSPALVVVVYLYIVRHPDRCLLGEACGALYLYSCLAYSVTC